MACSIKAFDRAFGTITGTRNLYGAKCWVHSVSRIRFRQAKADFPLVLLAPA